MITTNSIPLFSGASVNEDPKINLKAAVARVLDSHWYVLGNEVQKFETEFATYVGTSHCVSVANGTDALLLALRSCGIVAGDTVATVANAGFYSSTAIHAIGASPLYVEIDDVTLTMSIEALKIALLQRPKAVIVTHLYGQMADIEIIAEMCHKNQVLLIEDCAQAHGASVNAKMAGSFADLAAFSFYPTKNLGALGDGGAVTTKHQNFAEKIRTLRQYGWSHKYTVGMPHGCNSRLDEVQAAILREKLPHLNAQNELRRNIAQRYNHAFQQLPIRCPASTASNYVAHLYVIRMKNRELLRKHLQAHAIASDIHYPVPDHKQPAYPNIKIAQQLPLTETACETVLSLPCYPGLPNADVERVIAAVQSFFHPV